MGTHQAICTAPHCTAICSAVYHRLLCCLYRRSALKDFLTYILASFLVSWAQDLKGLEFQELIMFLKLEREGHRAGAVPGAYVAGQLQGGLQPLRLSSPPEPPPMSFTPGTQCDLNVLRVPPKCLRIGNRAAPPCLGSSIRGGAAGGPGRAGPVHRPDYLCVHCCEPHWCTAHSSLRAKHGGWWRARCPPSGFSAMLESATQALWWRLEKAVCAGNRERLRPGSAWRCLGAVQCLYWQGAAVAG